jgi:hypothetical protein
LNFWITWTPFEKYAEILNVDAMISIDYASGSIKSHEAGNRTGLDLWDVYTLAVEEEPDKIWREITR